MRAPPFGKDTRQQGGTIWLFLGGDPWTRAKNQRRLGWLNVTLLPPESSPSDFNWSFIADAAVVAIELAPTSQELRLSLIQILAAYGASEACLVPASKQHHDYVFWNCGHISEAA